MVSNDDFKAFASKVETDERDRAARIRSGGAQREYTEVKYTGLEKGKMKIIRGLGGVPNSDADNFTSRTIRHAQVVADDGKRIRVILPSKAEHPDYILWKVIDRVTEVEWVNKNKIFVHEKRHNDIFRMVTVNNYPEGSNQAKFDKGWAGRDYFVMNCIDREMMDWHKTNKHSVILSKQINTITTDDGKTLEFPEEGVPAYGFTNVLALNIFKFYGDWRNYDLGVEKLGLMQSPFRIINASKHEEEVPDELRPFIVVGPLTEEEASWEMYDLSKIFGVTSHTKLYNRLKLSIAKIDAALGSHYVDELKSLADMEAKERQERAASFDPSSLEEAMNSDATNPDKITPDILNHEIKETRSATSIGEPKGFAGLIPDERASITSWVPKTSGQGYNIVYTSAAKQYECPQCTTPSPEIFTSCPGCGLKF